MTEKNSGHAAAGTSMERAIRENIVRLRTARDWSQSELARRLLGAGAQGIHQTTIARIEAGDRPVRLSEAVALSRLFDVTLDDLVDAGASSPLRGELVSLSDWVPRIREDLEELQTRRATLARRLDDAQDADDPAAGADSSDAESELREAAALFLESTRPDVLAREATDKIAEILRFVGAKRAHSAKLIAESKGD